MDYHIRYYRSLADLHQKWHSCVQFVVFFLSLSIPLIGSAWDKWILPASLVLSVCVAWDYMSANARKAATLDGISRDCEKLLPRQSELFNSINYDLIGESEACQRLKELSQLSNEVTSRAGMAGITENQKLIVKCWDDSNAILLREQHEPQNA